MTHTKDGMNCVAMHDPVGRRGLWFKRVSDDAISVRAGREGDDAEAIITIGDTITREQLASLAECFEVAQYAYDITKETT